MKYGREIGAGLLFAAGIGWLWQGYNYVVLSLIILGVLMVAGDLRS